MTALSSRTSGLITADQFDTMPEIEDGFELVDGRLVKKPIPFIGHSLIARILTKKHDKFDPDEKVGRMLQEISTRLNDLNVPAPDVAFWTFIHKPKRAWKAADKPDLAIEIWSQHELASKKRRAEARDKVRRYFEAGVSEVWVINPKNQTVEIHRPDQQEPMQILQKGDELSAEDLIPGFKLAVADLFETD